MTTSFNDSIQMRCITNYITKLQLFLPVYQPHCCAGSSNFDFVLESPFSTVSLFP